MRPPIVPPSQRIHNWRALPVEGAGVRPGRTVERACNAAIVALAVVSYWLVVAR